MPPALFAPFDYVALGHLHGPQKAGERGQYSGSPLKYSVDEEHQKKGYFQLEWDGRLQPQEQGVGGAISHPLGQTARPGNLW